MKPNYQSLLNTENWQKKRKSILIRDNYTCKKCQSKINLQVHHIWYIKGKKPWQVPNEYLITLCNICHNNEHKGKKTTDFVLTKIKPVGKSKKDKVKNRINNLKASLSSKDKALQAKYDDLRNKR